MKIDSIAVGPDWLVPELVKELYRDRDYQPVFVAEDSTVRVAGNLMQVLRGSPAHGLSLMRFRRETIDSVATAISSSGTPWFLTWLTARKEPKEQALLDALLVDRYLAVAVELAGYRGLVRRVPDAERPEEPASAARADTVLHVLARGAPPPIEWWAPTHPQYAALQGALDSYRKLIASGGWSVVDPGETIRPGARDRRVAQIRRRLDREDVALGRSAAPAPSEPELYDDDLVARVRQFQERHALDADGNVGKGTIAEMNVTAIQRLRQIEVTLARWRDAPRQEPAHRVEVNIPGMMVYFYHGKLPTLALRTVVGSGRESPMWKGKTSRAETPELVDQIETIDVNPRWYIPEIIVRTELLEKEKQKPGFLDKGGYEWYDPQTGEHGPASSIPESDWTNPEKRLNLRQRSGQSNALGRIKFVFHNRYAVYLHDTPEKHLFRKGRRNFSHGCVRVENPAILAESLLAYSPKKAARPVAELMQDTARVVITLNPPVPIHLVYRTVWVDPAGTVQFLPDLYKRDPEVERSLYYSARRRNGEPSFARRSDNAAAGRAANR